MRNLTPSAVTVAEPVIAALKSLIAVPTAVTVAAPEIAPEAVIVYWVVERVANGVPVIAPLLVLRTSTHPVMGFRYK
jgi:hypothetical protein